MKFWQIFFFITLSLALTYVFTYVIRQHVIKNSILDVPNHRSAHTTPTPRGGGLGFVLTYFLLVFSCYQAGYLLFDTFIALFVSGALVAGVGYIDDKGHVAARWRLLVHLLAAAWGIFWLGGPPPVLFADQSTALQALLFIPFVLFIIWSINLYNFMDGIDGIAGSEAFTILFFGAIIYYITGNQSLSVFIISFAFSILGFLIWNFPPAKIFMGDAGSGFLGLLIALLALQAGWVESQLFYSWLILYAVFIIDATITLLFRALRKEKLYEAHNLHAYQKLTRKLKSHKKTTLSVILLNTFFLFPVSLLVALKTLSPIQGLASAYIPLVVLSLLIGSGRKNEL